MDLPPEQKINMSLESLIAVKNQFNKQKRTKNQNDNSNNNTPKTSGGLVISKPRRLAGRARANTNSNNGSSNAGPRRSNRSRPNSANTNNSANTANTAKVAKSVGTGRANRNASINQRRGLNSTGKATNAQVKNEVNKQLAKSPAGGGLKITFKPGELNKTTDRGVSQQIRAVLARQTTRSPKAMAAIAAAAEKGSRAGSANSQGTRRGNPKTRKNVIHVKH